MVAAFQDLRASFYDQYLFLPLLSVYTSFGYDAKRIYVPKCVASCLITYIKRDKTDKNERLKTQTRCRKDLKHVK